MVQLKIELGYLPWLSHMYFLHSHLYDGEQCLCLLNLPAEAAWSTYLAWSGSTTSTSRLPVKGR